MNPLQKVLEKSLAEVPNKMLAQLLRKKLSEEGVKVTERRAEILAKQLLAGKSKMSLPGSRTETVNVSISAAETETFAYAR